MDGWTDGWFIVLDSGTIGLPMNISATMQPTAHMSTANVYELEPRMISGGRYLYIIYYILILM